MNPASDIRDQDWASLSISVSVTCYHDPAQGLSHLARTFAIAAAAQVDILLGSFKDNIEVMKTTTLACAHIEIQMVEVNYFSQRTCHSL